MNDLLGQSDRATRTNLVIRPKWASGVTIRRGRLTLRLILNYADTIPGVALSCRRRGNYLFVPGCTGLIQAGLFGPKFWPE